VVTAQSLGLSLDEKSYVPYYQQIVEQVRGLVRRGRLVEGASFCSEQDLAATLGISKMPVRQAYQKLRSEGLLVVAKGKRPIIGSGRVEWSFEQLHGFGEEMRRRGLQPSARALSCHLVIAPGEVARALRLETGEKVYCLTRLRLVNGEPMALVKSYMPERLFPEIDKQDLGGRSLYAIFEIHYKRKLAWAEESITAVLAEDHVATILETEVASPLLRIRETIYDQDRVAIEFSDSLLRGDRYTATVVAVRKRAIT